MVRDFFWRLVEILFYRPVRARYIRFDRTKEYLIIYQKKRRFVPYFKKEQTHLLSAIGQDPFGRFLMPRVHRLKNKGVPVDTEVMTWEEFHNFAFDDPIIKYDQWLLLRAEAIHSGAAVR